MSQISSIDPYPLLIDRIRGELGSLFDLASVITLACAPESVDVIGGLLDRHGGNSCAMPIDVFTTVAVQSRPDRQISIFDFDQYDQQRPFTLQMSADALMSAPVAALQRNLAEPGRRFAAPIIAAGRAMFESRPDLATGLNIANQPGAGGMNEQACVVATLQALGAEDDQVQLLSDRAATLAGLPTISSTQLGAALGRSSLELPAGVRIVAFGIGSTIDPTERAAIEVAAKMAHVLILSKMRQFGKQAGRELVSDPMDGHIGNLKMSDYKRFFRGILPESIRGDAFLSQYGPIEGVDLEAKVSYAPQFVADHLVIESHRVNEFRRHLAEAKGEADVNRRKLMLDKAGHLLYASHISQRESCGFGTDIADAAVKRVRDNESLGFYGSRLAVDGAMVALCDCSESADQLLTSLTKARGGDRFAMPAERRPVLRVSPTRA